MLEPIVALKKCLFYVSFDVYFFNTCTDDREIKNIVNSSSQNFKSYEFGFKGNRGLDIDMLFY